MALSETQTVQGQCSRAQEAETYEAMGTPPVIAIAHDYICLGLSPLVMRALPPLSTAPMLAGPKRPTSLSFSPGS